jgi:hypothetical protein
MLQPWVDAAPKEPGSKDEDQAPLDGQNNHPLQSFIFSLESALSELIIEGVERAGLQVTNQWRMLTEESDSLGFIEVSRTLRALHKSLVDRQHNLSWTAATAASSVLKLSVLYLVTREVILETLTSAGEPAI